MTLVAQASNHIAIGTECGIQGNLRSTADHDAADSVSKTISKQAGHVIINDLHLTTLELSNLVQTDLVLLRVLIQECREKSLERRGAARRREDRRRV